MNRTIKFRGKDKENGKWVYGYFYTIQEIEHYILQPCTFGVLHSEVIPETVGQFTGILDKNGREIYEGDIVEQRIKKGYGYGFIGEVIFSDGKIRIKHKAHKGYAVSDYSYSSEWNEGYARVTILYEYELKGNIYDNKDLLP